MVAVSQVKAQERALEPSCQDVLGNCGASRTGNEGQCLLLVVTVVDLSTSGTALAYSCTGCLIPLQELSWFCLIF